MAWGGVLSLDASAIRRGHFLTFMESNAHFIVAAEASSLLPSMLLEEHSRDTFCNMMHVQRQFVLQMLCTSTLVYTPL